MKNLFGETPVRFFAIAVLIILLALVFVAVEILLVPFVAALFVVYLFEPAIVILQRRGMERGPAFLLLLSLTAISIAVALGLMPSWLRLESISGSSQTFTERIASQLNAMEYWVKAKFPMFGSVSIAAVVNARAASLAGPLLSGTAGIDYRVHRQSDLGAFHRLLYDPRRKEFEAAVRRGATQSIF